MEVVLGLGRVELQRLQHPAFRLEVLVDHLIHRMVLPYTRISNICLITSEALGIQSQVLGLLESVSPGLGLLVEGVVEGGRLGLE